MTLEFRECRQNSIGELCIRVLDMNALRKFLDAYATDRRKDKRYTLEIKRWYPLRSKDANAYLWTLCGLLADELSKDGDIVTKDEVYTRHVREVGIYQDITVNAKAEATFRKVWQAYGTGWPCERVDSAPGGAVIRCYYGSSTYNSAQMHRLIDSVAQECDQLGIETMPPDKLAALIQDWRPK